MKNRDSTPTTCTDARQPEDTLNLYKKRHVTSTAGPAAQYAADRMHTRICLWAEDCMVEPCAAAWEGHADMLYSRMRKEMMSIGTWYSCMSCTVSVPPSTKKMLKPAKPM